QRKQSLRRNSISAFDLFQDAGDLAHTAQRNARSKRMQSSIMCRVRIERDIETRHVLDFARPAGRFRARRCEAMNSATPTRAHPSVATSDKTDAVFSQRVSDCVRPPSRQTKFSGW